MNEIQEAPTPLPEEGGREERQEFKQPINEYPIVFGELETLVEQNREVERWVENVRHACYAYDSDIGRVGELRVKKDKTQQDIEGLNELENLARYSLRSLEDSLNILSRRCSDLGMSNQWRGEFYTATQIGDWGIRVVANWRRKENRELQQKQVQNA